MITFDREKLIKKIKELKENEDIDINKLVQDNAELIENNKFTFLYNDNRYINRRSILIALLLLSGINFIDYMQSIPDFCFHGLPITSIEIPEGIENIGYMAFSECKYLNKLVIPTSVTEIGRDILHGNTRLEQIDYNGSMDSWVSKIFKHSSDWKRDWKRDSKVESIKCYDGEITIREPLLYIVRTKNYDKYTRPARKTPKGTITITIPHTTSNPSSILLFKSVEDAEELQIILERAYGIPFEIVKYNKPYEKLVQADLNNIISVHNQKVEDSKLQLINAYIKVL